MDSDFGNENKTLLLLGLFMSSVRQKVLPITFHPLSVYEVVDMKYLTIRTQTGDFVLIWNFHDLWSLYYSVISIAFA